MTNLSDTEIKERFAIATQRFLDLADRIGGLEELLEKGVPESDASLANCNTDELLDELRRRMRDLASLAERPRMTGVG